MQQTSKYFILVLLLFGRVSFSSAQLSELDSLKQVAATATVDSIKAKALSAIAWKTAEEDPAGSLEKSFEGLSLAQKSGNRFIEADCYKSIGVGYDYKGNLDSCIYFLNLSLAIYKDQNNIIKQSNVLSDIAFGYYARGIYEIALKNHLSALDLRKQADDKILLGKSYNNIGLVYKARKDYANAIRYYHGSLDIKKELNDQQGLLNTTLNIGSLYQSMTKFDSALFFANEALAMAKKLGSMADITGAETNIGIALLGLDELDESEKYFNMAEKEALSTGCKNCFHTIYHGLGNIFMKRKDFKKALYYFMKSLEIAVAANKKEMVYNAYSNLYQCYYRMGKYQQAYQYRDSSDQVASVMLNNENIRQMNEMTAVYETAEKEKQIEKLSIDARLNISEAKQRSRERNIFIGASVLLLALSALAFSAYRSNKKKKEELDEKNKLIGQSLAEKEVLMKEIHHRVKNNLQIVSSLLSLQSYYIKDEQALDAVKDSRNRVQSMALIHQNLYQEDNLTGIDVQDYISKLCDSLFSSYNIRKDQVKLIKEIQPMMLDVDTVVPLGLIINELITNSLKYGFAGNKTGTIKVILKEESKVLKLHVYDNGPGLPDNFELNNLSSFGYKMINSFMQKLSGTIRVYNDEGARAEVEITNYKITGA